MNNYCISKASYDSESMIDKAEVYLLNENSFGQSIEMPRSAIIKEMSNGHKFNTITKDDNGQWFISRDIHIERGYIKCVPRLGLYIDIYDRDNIGSIPFLLTKRKTFISYHHKDDEIYRTKFEYLTRDLIINKSVGPDDILSDNSDEYVKQLIQKEYLKDTTVLVVLVGAKTKCRKHIDWEISGALNYKVGDIYSGIAGIILPSHPDFRSDDIKHSNLPTRLHENVKSGYAKIIKWSNDRKNIQDLIEDAFSGRVSRKDKRINSLAQMQQNTCN